MARERMLLLYLRTGGGHLAAARAIERRVSQAYSRDDVEALLLDPMPPTSLFWSALFERGYRMTSNHVRQLWVGAILMTRTKVVRYLWNEIMARLFWRRIAEEVVAHDITKVVILHSLLVTPTLYALKRCRKNPETITVVLDPFTVPEFWLQRTGGPMVLFSERAREQAMRQFGYPASKLPTFPLILGERYGERLSAERVESLRAELGFTRNKRVVLLAGGGEGLPNALRHARALFASDLDVEIAIVCGRDERTRSRIQRMAAGYPGKAIHVFGFVDFMFELMNIADIVVAKGGPATVMEALMLGKPLIISQYLFGQERGNVDFVIRNRVGSYEERSEAIVERIRALVEDPGAYERHCERIDGLRLRNGTSDVVDFLVSYRSPPATGTPARRWPLAWPEGRRPPFRQVLALVGARSGDLSLAKRRKGE